MNSQGSPAFSCHREVRPFAQRTAEGNFAMSSAGPRGHAARADADPSGSAPRLPAKDPARFCHGQTLVIFFKRLWLARGWGEDGA